MDEAERLLTVLQNGAGLEKDGLGKAVGSALEKAGAVLGSVARTVGEKAEQLQPVCVKWQQRLQIKLMKCSPK